MPTPEPLALLHEAPGLLVVNKPAGLVCHPTKAGEWSSLVGRARLHCGSTARPQLINRLDRETSGLVLIATDDEVARQLRRLWEAHAVTKEYLAIVEGHVATDTGTVDAPLGRDEQSRVAIKDGVRPDGAPATTRFQVERRFQRADGPFSLLRVIPQTGRKHQIRIHLAHLGHPIVGDKIYGPDEDCYLALVEDRLTEDQRRRLRTPHHALHAERVSFDWLGCPRSFQAPPEEWFRDFLDGVTQPAAVGQPPGRLSSC